MKGAGQSFNFLLNDLVASAFDATASVWTWQDCHGALDPATAALPLLGSKPANPGSPGRFAPARGAKGEPRYDGQVVWMIRVCLSSPAENRRPHCHRRPLALAAAAATTLAAAYPARAQLISQYLPPTLPGYESDLTLPMAPYDARVAAGRGVEIGDFNLAPKLSESAGYNSNPLGDGSRGSSLLDTNASVSLGSDWARDALDASLSVDNTSYFDRPIASQTSWSTSLGGRLDVGNGSVDAAYSHLAENLGPTDLGVLGVTDPVPYQVDNLRLDDNIVLGRFRITPSFGYEHVTFGQAAGPIPIDYSSLDHDVLSGGLTALYALSTGRSLVAVLQGATAAYSTGLGASESNYSDVLGLAGIDIQAAALIRIRALVGGESRTFNQAATQSMTTPTAELDVIWQPTRLTTVTTTVSRRFQDATSPFSNSQATTDGRFQVDHALRRNVELSAYVDVGSSGFSANAVDTAANNTSQMQTSFGASAVWTVNRHVNLLLTYNYSQNSYTGGLVTMPGSFVQPNETFNTVELGLTLSE